MTSLHPIAHGGPAPARPASPSRRDDDGFGFADLLDVINPLQHIPVVNAIYREITGDTISAPAKIAGGGLFGGVLGLMASVFDTVVEEATGKDMTHHVAALFDGDAGPEDPGPGINLAAGDSPEAAPPASEAALARGSVPVRREARPDSTSGEGGPGSAHPLPAPVADIDRAHLALAHARYRSLGLPVPGQAPGDIDIHR